MERQPLTTEERDRFGHRRSQSLGAYRGRYEPRKLTPCFYLRIEGPIGNMRVAIVHDYLTQRGGAERVVLSMLKAFPKALVYTSLYDPNSTFQEFRNIEVRTLPIDRIGTLRRNHRLALPLLAPAFSQLKVDADVVICS